MNRMMAFVGVGLLVSLLAALSDCVPARAPDAGCVLACKHLTDLGCEEGGSECVPRCDEYQSGGLDMHTGCLARVSSCDETVGCSLE